MHLRELFRAVMPVTPEEQRAHQRREEITRNLLSNLLRTKDHPTVRTVLAIAESYSLTLDGAHRLFGYELDRIRDYDLELNRGRTHIVESYPFDRDLPIDLPQRLHETNAGRSSTLRELVPDWQRGLPIRSLDGPVWSRQGTFYVHVGTEDSLGSGLPPGAMALVEPISDVEQRRPNPRAMYLLQFGNGYRCSRCVLSRNKLLLLIEGRQYTGPQEFAYPGNVRIVGKIRMFAMALPAPEYASLRSLPLVSRGAPLVLPWEHASQASLFATKYLRFQRSSQERSALQEELRTVFASKLTGRTERRYRAATSSQPHVDILIQMAITHTARYSDALHAAQSLPSDRRRFSLQTLLDATSVREITMDTRRATAPEPNDVWLRLREDFLEWPAPLSMKFPQPQAFEDRVIRMPEAVHLDGLSPPLTPGSVLLLEALTDAVNPIMRGSGWSRPIYVLRRGTEVLCGYLRAVENRIVLTRDLRDTAGDVKLSEQDMRQLSRVIGAAVPV